LTVDQQYFAVSCYRIVYMQGIDGAGKVPRKWSYRHTSCRSCHYICCTACVLRICAVSQHAGVSVMHSSVICEASFTDLASRAHLVRHNGMSARHYTSCTVSAMVDLVGFMSRVWFLSTCRNAQSRVFTVQSKLPTRPAHQLNDRQLRCRLQLKSTSVTTSVPFRT
jgi:hypothetical protein